MYGDMFQSFFYMKSFCIRQKNLPKHIREIVVDGEGFEPSKASPADLQSVPFGHSGIHP